MTTNPYSNLDRKSYWRTGVVEGSFLRVKDIYNRKWEIEHNAEVATAGSCFAQHISRHLRNNGLNVLDLEPGPDLLDESARKKHQYGLYSARYGNIYTSRQLLQLAKEAFEEGDCRETIWEKDGRYFDAYRPGVEPGGLASEIEVYSHRKFHISKVRELFSRMDILIFTLGLTELWMKRENGEVYGIAPGTIAGAYDPELHAFANLSYEEIRNDIVTFKSLVESNRMTQKPLRILLTVSPVPLTATASGHHVLAATTYSKSVLRAVAGSLSEQNEFDYFPSYEIITNVASRSVFYEQNLRNVTDDGVSCAMNAFLSAHLSSDNLDKFRAEEGNSEHQTEITKNKLTTADIDNALACEEALYDAA